MTSHELYCKGARVWVPCAEDVWEGAEVRHDYKGGALVILTERGKEQELTIKDDKELPPLRNPDILIGENDLTSLSYLHEPAVLYNLKVRFCSQNAIYTYCGIVLVAINPYHELPIYGPDTVWAYRGQALGDLDPHIFAVAEEAYTKLERESRDQSIIVSGESGAGKTVSAKYAMRYFATVGGAASETQVEKKVLASNPIMEAIGNAKTTRNDNSSRFGKFIEIHFDKRHHIQGASMRTYLLEKSRVVFQAPGERNYHVFYQLCAARGCAELAELRLGPCESFRFTNQGDDASIPGVDDAHAFEDTKNALTLLGFGQEQQARIFRTLGAVLHLGNVSICEAQEAESRVAADDAHLKQACALLQVDEKALRKWLCTRRIVSMRDEIMKAMPVGEASAAKDALAKHVYAQLFSWIVRQINRELENTGRGQSFIGVLDIYGFETFEINSFEQFCINYANEKLQQQFNQHVFKLEQEEYLKEEIEWKLIDFYDNQPCIDLIEAKLGILDLLDEECRMPKGSDSSWAEKLYERCKKSKHFNKPRFGTHAYIIHHFADEVEYQSGGFLDKNRDTVIEEQIEVLRQSKDELIRALFLEEAAPVKQSATKVKVLPAATGTATKSHKKTVGSQFRDSLNMLMQTLNATTPHYVRCIKPNDSKAQFEYNPKRAVQQLRACGVLETIRISAAGFPSRWTYPEFFQRYRVLCRSSDVDRANMKRTCEHILKRVIKEEDHFCFGKTKIFFRAGQVAYLEKLRADRLRACCLMMQRTVRGWLQRRRYTKIMRAVRGIQTRARGVLARRRTQNERERRAAIRIQKQIRGWMARQKFRAIRKATVGLQTRARGMLARRRYMALRYNAKAIIIQRWVRGWLARRRYLHATTRLVLAQSVIRRFLARRKLKKLKAEARSVEHVKKLNKGLENKIISLQQRIEEMNKEQQRLKGASGDLSVTKQQLEKLKAAELISRKLPEKIAELEEELRIAKEQLRHEIDDKIDLTNAAARKEKEYIQQLENVNKHNQGLKQAVEQLNERLKSAEKAVREDAKMQIEKEKAMLIQEQDEERMAYQKLLADHQELQSRYEAALKPTPAPRGRRMSNDAPEEDSGMWGEEDVGLVLKLQQKVRELEREKERFQQQVEKFETRSEAGEEVVRAKDHFRLQELEMENEKLRTSMTALKNAASDKDSSGVARELSRQTEALTEELVRRREECIQLRCVLASQTQTLEYGSESELINEDGELIMALETQKKINRQLEEEVQSLRKRHERREAEWRAEEERLREETDAQQKILAIGLNGSPQSQTEAYMQHEIRRLTGENLDLQEKIDSLMEQLRKQRKASKVKRRDGDTLPMAKQDQLPESTSPQPQPPVPVMRKKERDYMGMFEYQSGEETLIIRRIIYELKPKVAVTLLPGLPAYILFMCIRHTDFKDDDEKVRTLLTNAINGLRKVIKKRSEDLDTHVLWLSNTLRLLHTLKQYSGDKAFQADNTPAQNEQCLRNFDLSQYRQVLSDIAICIYQALMKHLESRVQPLVQPAVLEHEAITGLSSNKPAGMRGRSEPLSPVGAAADGRLGLNSLLDELSFVHRTLVLHGADPEVVTQIFRQLFYFICAAALNTLLLRKDLCHWSKGMQIRYNISHLEQWLRDHRVSDKSVVDTLQPIIQASQLLQARKTENDVVAVCEMCDKLSVFQIIKILNLYTPADEYEERVPASFIRQIQERLGERAESQGQATLLMDSKFSFPVRFPFNPSNIRLEDVEVPDVLNLPMLRKV
ncbi:unconventional myosin-Va isoform X2 [Neocloeon triangulifer]|uniref:unconventional myosin-Va isoform X2 n=1 Tax=Neocloeon triangulifer TaxID=2078957 RepID=UPI00286EE0AF|nr:unconventional myosin-Va isoform X2 [Neocloeon triangulifer]